MSLRNQIAQNIVDTLENHQATGKNIKKVYRAPTNIDDIARTAFPAAVLTSADESREDISMGGKGIRRSGTIIFWVDLYAWGDHQDETLNELIETVENVLDVDRTRGGAAMDTVINNIQLLTPNSAQPLTSARVFVEVDYQFIRGAS